ncbi:LacI family DNA-binding transcriptional regulator [Corynebacterium lowii]|uniref:Catabolite control protein A n=1 Tax=Corynebacterium lowii TaxID=1544413 RepID=A0A0Q1E365_9CORY|nr:LacI family DNA-binding transcriptional regulator [Corynebacterium lowii]KQB87101.1 Catabolite control protein A [Corynebacterium lowii]MDP9852313.1 LacI family transcriptional regulator [Corynebacterium lowii]
MANTPPSRHRIHVTMDDVARTTNLSRATVSRALSGNPNVSPETQAKVRRAIKELGYIPNRAAQSLASERQRNIPTVGLLLRTPEIPAYAKLHTELNRQTDDMGMQMITAIPTISGNRVDEPGTIKHLLRTGVNAIYLATGTIDPAEIERSLDTVPMITVGRPELHDAVSSVSHDEDVNGRIIAEAVINHGHTHIGVAVTDPHVSVPEHHRSQSITRYLRGSGATVHEVPILPSAHQMESINHMFHLCRENKITAAMFPSDHRALAFMSLCMTAGVSIPRDISVTGIDAISPELKYLGLSSVRIAIEAVASRAAALMQQRLTYPQTPVQHEAFPGVLADGRTLGAPAF